MGHPVDTTRGTRGARWRASVRVALGALVVGIAAFALAPAEARADEGDNVTPVFECAQVNADGSSTAFFGYLSPSREPQQVELGSDNRFSPSPADRGQPSTFSPGRHVSVFSVRVPVNGSVTWHLDGNAASSSMGRPCSGNPVVSEFGTVGAAVVAVGLPVAVWYRRGRRLTRRPAPAAG
jgi:hypothetical protein